MCNRINFILNRKKNKENESDDDAIYDDYGYGYDNEYDNYYVSDSSSIDFEYIDDHGLIKCLFKKCSTGFNTLEHIVYLISELPAYSSLRLMMSSTKIYISFKSKKLYIN